MKYFYKDKEAAIAALQSKVDKCKQMIAPNEITKKMEKLK